jgi:hypothetical protein
MGFTLGLTVFLRNLFRGPHYNAAATLKVVANGRFVHHRRFS